MRGWYAGESHLVDKLVEIKSLTRQKVQGARLRAQRQSRPCGQAFDAETCHDSAKKLSAWRPARPPRGARQQALRNQLCAQAGRCTPSRPSFIDMIRCAGRACLAHEAAVEALEGPRKQVEVERARDVALPVPVECRQAELGDEERLPARRHLRRSQAMHKPRRMQL